MKNIVNHSTEESRANQQISVLAIAETLFFMLFTWAIAWCFDTYVHIYTALVIAPLLLLKSPQSIELANRLFLQEINFKTPFYRDLKYYLVLLPSTGSAFIFTYSMASYFLIDQSGWSLFGYAFLIGLGALVVAMTVAVEVVMTVAGAVAGVAAVTAGGAGGAVVAGVAGVAVAAVGRGRGRGGGGVAVAFALGYFIRSIVVKCCVTAYVVLCKHPLKSLQGISANYREQLAVNDVYYSPELLPNIGKSNSIFQLNSLYKDVKDKSLWWVIVSFPLFLLWSLAYFYRWSIKSTAWFYWPLSFLTRIPSLTDKKSQIRHAVFIGISAAVIPCLLSMDTSSFDNPQIIVEHIFAFLYHLQHIWLLILALCLHAVLAFYWTIAQVLTLKNADLPTQYAVIATWVARFIIALWYIFLFYNAVVLFEQHAWNDLSDWLRRLLP